MLFIKNARGRYRPATEEEILAAAGTILQPRIVGTSLESPREALDFLQAKLARLPHEVFCCLFLDNRHRILAFEEMFRGTLNGTAVYPREIVKRALSLNAAAVILVHNHPSGVAEPSRADQALTERLRDALALIEVRVLDHIVIGDGETVSFSERGML